MKRVIIAICLILAVTVTCIIEQNIMNKSFKKTEEQVEKIVAEVKSENYSAATDSIKILKADWIKLEDKLAVFIPRRSLDDITDSAMMLNSLCNADDKNMLLAECDKIKEELNHIKEKENMSFNNVI